MFRSYFISLIFFCCTLPLFSQTNTVKVLKINDGFRLSVDGSDFLIKGMNWSYHPIGTNYTYSLWKQPDDSIAAVLQTEMSLMKDMGVNTIKTHSEIPKKWIAYIFNNFEIYTIINHHFGRYGIEVKGEWRPNTDYGDPEVQKVLLDQVSQLAGDYNGTPGLLLYLLGNESNYGLFWQENETDKETVESKKSILDTRAMYKLFLSSSSEESPGNEIDDTQIDQKALIRARAMYKLFNQSAVLIKSNANSLPVAISNGDLMFIDIIKEECSSIDIFGTNIYRGISLGDSFQKVRQILDMPILFTEIGADAYNAISEKEDQHLQAYFLKGNWKEIFENVSGIGGAENAIGGLTYEFSDSWWKYDQTSNFKIQDIKSTWHNGGYYLDSKDGINNMNEEWFGICSKVPIGTNGYYKLKPRTSYYLLKSANQIDIYDPSYTLVDLKEDFSKINFK
ncbi:MAG: hypothetical protein NXI20_03100 [bacterium]|nr:hypothetical protein [bacterium]